MPRLHRFYLKNNINNLNQGDEFLLDCELTHRILTVLRLKKETIFELFDSNQNIYRVNIKNINKNKKNLLINILEIIKNNININNKKKINLYQAIAKKPNTMSLMLQKATELGVDKIYLLITDYSAVTPRFIDTKQLQRWQAIIIAAAEQSQRLTIPELNVLNLDLINIINNIKTSDINIFLDPDSALLLADFYKNNNILNKNINIFIGPEGGWSDAERQLAYKHNFNVLKLGEEILRLETATLAILAILKFIN